MNAEKRIGTVVTFAVVAIAVLAPMVQGYPLSQLGILKQEIMDANNPATGEPWADGDTYRLVFYTSGKMSSESSDISVYNEFVQSFANATDDYDIGADEGVTWKVIGSTADIDAIDNTSTQWTEDDPGGPIFLLDGSTIVANSHEDLWDGSIQHIINLTELGTAPTYFWPCTGTYWDGTKSVGHPRSGGALGGGGEIQQGNLDVLNTWVWRTNTTGTNTKERPLYAISDPLVITGDPARPDVVAGEDWITWSGQEVTLDTTVTNNDPNQPQVDLIYAWSSSDNDNLNIVITPKADPADATVLITKKLDTGDVTVVKITLTVTLPGKTPVKAHMKIDVHDTACSASTDLGMSIFETGDLNKDCYTNILDITMIAEQWLNNYSITEATVRN